MTPDLDALAALLAAATPGPWKSRTGHAPDKFEPEGYKYVQFGPTEAKSLGYGTDQLKPADADLIAELRNNAAALIEAARREAGLLQEFDELRDQVAVAFIALPEAGEPLDEDLIRSATLRLGEALDRTTRFLHDNAGAATGLDRRPAVDDVMRKSDIGPPRTKASDG